MKKKLYVLVIGLFVLASTTFCVFIRPNLQFNPDQMPDGKVGTAYSVSISISGNQTPVGDISISDGSLPPGLTLTMDKQLRTGILAGTPTQAGTYQFSVFVWCYGTNVGGQTATKQYKLVVGN